MQVSQILERGAWEGGGGEWGGLVSQGPGMVIDSAWNQDLEEDDFPCEVSKRRYLRKRRGPGHR